MPRPSRLLALLVLLPAAACGGAAPQPPAASQAPAASGSAAPVSRGAGSVFVVVMENRDYKEALAMPYVAQLASRFALATDYHAVAHPSLPNYLALTSGSTWNVHDDGWHQLPVGGLGAELSAHGVSWRAYMEGMSRGCRDSPAPYALKHDPFPYYGGQCPPQVVSTARLAADLAHDTPRFVWITPDLCHDGHDCESRVADRYLSGLVPPILASPAWRQGGLLLLTWDEADSDSGDNRVATLVIAPELRAHATGRRHDHYSLLATVEDRLGVPRLGQAAQAQPFDELLG